MAFDEKGARGGWPAARTTGADEVPAAPQEAPAPAAPPAAAATIAEALDAYGRTRLRGAGPVTAAGVAAALQVIAGFCDAVLPDLLDPVTRRRFARAEDAAPREVLGAPLLGRAIGPCARLAPYQVVAGSGVIAAFSRELPRLARWLRREGHIDALAHAGFDQEWTLARLDLDRQLRLQLAIEDALQHGLSGHETDEYEGRYAILRRDGRGIWIDGGDGERGPVRVPRGFERLFAPGRRVSLAIRRALCGWQMAGAALPEPAELTAAIDGVSPRGVS